MTFPLNQHAGTARHLELSRQADAILSALPQDPEYPFYTEAGQLRRRRGRGRMGVRFREVAVSDVTLAEVTEARESGALAERTAREVDSEALLRRADLSTEERCCLLLRVRYELSDVEIAGLFGRHREWVGQRRSRAVQKLRQVEGVREMLD